MHVVVGEVLHLVDLDQPLDLLAHLVGLGVAVVDFERDARKTRLAPRTDRDAADMKAAAPDRARKLGERMRTVLNNNRQDPDAGRRQLLPIAWGGGRRSRPEGVPQLLSTWWGGARRSRPEGVRQLLPT